MVIGFDGNPDQNFHNDADPDPDPDDADPHADRTTSFKKSLRPSLHCFIFLNSAQVVIIFSILDNILKFSEKCTYCLSLPHLLGTNIDLDAENVADPTDSGSTTLILVIFL